MARRDITVKIVVPTSGSLLKMLLPEFIGSLRKAAAHPRTRRLRRTPYFFLARFALRASFFCTPAGWSMKRKRIPSTIALYLTAPVERPSSLAASRAESLDFARARIFFRSAEVQEHCVYGLIWPLIESSSKSMVV